MLFYSAFGRRLNTAGADPAEQQTRVSNVSGLSRHEKWKIEKRVNWRIDRTILQIRRAVSSPRTNNLRRDFAGRFGRAAPDGERGQPGDVHAVRHHVVRPGLLRGQRDARRVHEGIQVRAVDRTDRVADGLKRTSTGPVRANSVVRRLTPTVFIYVSYVNYTCRFRTERRNENHVLLFTLH